MPEFDYPSTALDDALNAACARTGCPRLVVDAVLTLAIEIAREGHEGLPIGTLFTIGCPHEILANSRPLILDPLAGHAPDGTSIADERLRGTLKELAHLDGAFVVTNEGTVLAACRYLDSVAKDFELPLGLGSRHVTAAAVSKRHRVIAVVVSAAGVVRIFCDGEIVASITRVR